MLKWHFIVIYTTSKLVAVSLKHMVIPTFLISLKIIFCNTWYQSRNAVIGIFCDSICFSSFSNTLFKLTRTQWFSSKCIHWPFKHPWIKVSHASEYLLFEAYWIYTRMDNDIQHQVLIYINRIQHHWSLCNLKKKKLITYCFHPVLFLFYTTLRCHEICGK